MALCKNGDPGQIVTLHGQLLADDCQTLLKLRGEIRGGKALRLLKHPGKTCSRIAQRRAGGLQRWGIQRKQGCRYFFDVLLYNSEGFF